MKKIKIKNVWVFACTVPLLLLADIFVYIIIHIKVKVDINNLGMWIVQFCVYIFLVMVMIYLSFCLGLMVNNDKNKLKFFLVFLIIINLIFTSSKSDFGSVSKEFVALSVWLVTDIIIAGITSIKFDEFKLKSFFKTTKITKTYRKYGKEIKEEEKTYPVLLPIIVAIISASGAIIASVITKK